MLAAVLAGLVGVVVAEPGAEASPLMARVDAESGRLSSEELAATATTATSAPGLGEAPLSDEDLALIDSITDPDGAVATASSALRPPPAAWHLDRERLRSVVPRTLGEALLAAPSALAVRRSHVAGDDLLLRGRGGARPVVRLDGLSLDHALTRYDERGELGALDPWMLESVRIGEHDRVELTSLAPRLDGVHTWVAAVGRSADRSSGFSAAVDGGLGPVGLLLGGSYADLGAVRTDATHPPSPWPYQRASLRARARVLGREGDPVELRLGADLDRLTNVEDRGVRDEDRLRRALVLDGRLSLGELEAGVVVGLRDHTVERAPAALVSREDAQTVEARARVAYRWEPLSVGIAGAALVSEGAVEGTRRAEGRAHTIEGAIELGLALPWLEADARLALVDAATEVLDVESAAREWTTEGRVVARPSEGWAIEGAWRYGLRLPTVGDVLAYGAGVTLPERALLVEVGPSLRLGAWGLGAVGYLRWIERALEPVSSGATYVEGALIGGAEGRVSWQPLPELTLTGAGGWTAADRVLAGIPGLVLAGSGRWAASSGSWALEVAGRALVPTAEVSSAEAPPPRTLSVVERREWAGALVSVRGMVRVAAGFVLTLALDNVLDVRTRGYGSAINDPGLDLRVALSHAW